MAAMARGVNAEVSVNMEDSVDRRALIVDKDNNWLKRIMVEGQYKDNDNTANMESGDCGAEGGIECFPQHIVVFMVVD